MTTNDPEVAQQRALRLSDEQPLGAPLARDAGSLCGAARTADVIDASVAIAAHAAERPSTIVTSDPSDLAHLLDHLGSEVGVLALRPRQNRSAGGRPSISARPIIHARRSGGGSRSAASGSGDSPIGLRARQSISIRRKSRRT